MNTILAEEYSAGRIWLACKLEACCLKCWRKLAGEPRRTCVHRALGSYGYGLTGYRIQQSLWWSGSSRRATMAMGLPQRSQSTAGLGWLTTGGGVGM